MVISDTAGGQIMGDWAQGEFQVAGETAGKDYTCLPGLGLHEVISTGGDAFYFPVLQDAEQSAAQEVLASVMMSPETQVAFNLKKGSLPVRGDVDLATANDCMQKGLKILADGGVIQSSDELIDPDSTTQINDLFAQFFSDMSITPEDAQKRFAELIAAAQ
jgi:glucose/mannose transport system substrate-binding protein